MKQKITPDTLTPCHKSLIQRQHFNPARIFFCQKYLRSGNVGKTGHRTGPPKSPGASSSVIRLWQQATYSSSSDLNTSTKQSAMAQMTEPVSPHLPFLAPGLSLRLWHPSVCEAQDKTLSALVCFSNPIQFSPDKANTDWIFLPKIRKAWKVGLLIH